jgi:hypothetical protein
MSNFLLRRPRGPVVKKVAIGNEIRPQVLTNPITPKLREYMAVDLADSEDAVVRRVQLCRLIMTGSSARERGL